MKKNDLFSLKITDMGVDGEGIGKYDGMTFFVKDALIGDEIRARATKLKKHYGYARVEKIITPSPYRVEPQCPLHRRCGGCQIQALSYEEQLAFKENKVRSNLQRIGGFSKEELEQVCLPIVGMEHPFRYRNKAQFPVGLDKEGKLVTGFYAARTHAIIPVEDCLLGVEENKDVLMAVKEWMLLKQIPAYDETTGTGLVRHILIRYGFTTEEVMVCLIINGDRLPEKEALIERLSVLPGMTSISYNVNTERTNVILGKHTECIWGMPYITDYIHLRNTGDFSVEDTAIAYHISPQSFYQVNPVQTEKLYSLALSYAGLTGRETVWDLYCGIGTISLFLAQKAKKVYGVEIIPQAIDDARANAKLNHFENVEFFVGKAELYFSVFSNLCCGYFSPGARSFLPVFHPKLLCRPHLRHWLYSALFPRSALLPPVHSRSAPPPSCGKQTLQALPARTFLPAAVPERIRQPVCHSDCSDSPCSIFSSKSIFIKAYF